MPNFTRHLRILAALLLLVSAAAWGTPEPSATLTGPALPSAFDDPEDVPLPDPDLWERIRMGFALEPLDSPLVHDQEDWYASRPDYIKRFVGRGSLYLHYIVEQVEKRKMPTEIALLPIVESAFTPKAQSRAKASGLWQFIPSTGKNFGLKQDWWRDNRRDVVAATDAALNYLQRLRDKFDSWELALAAYNCGEGNVARAIAYNQKRGLPTDYLSLRLPPETRMYVPKLIAVKNIVLSPPTYGIELDSVPDQPYFTTVDAPAKMDVKLAAKLANMSEEDFIALNPAYNKPVAMGGKIVLPIDKADDFKANLESWDKPLVTWTTYNARRGESMDAIAKHHGLTGAALRAANENVKLDKRGRLRAAGAIMVPLKGSAQPIRVASLSVPAASAPTASSRAVAAHVAVANPDAQPSAAKTYVVRAGDTLFSIAQRFNTAVDTLRKLNNLSARSLIHPGLTLRLP